MHLLRLKKNLELRAVDIMSVLSIEDAIHRLTCYRDIYNSGYAFFKSDRAALPKRPKRKQTTNKMSLKGTKL